MNYRPRVLVTAALAAAFTGCTFNPPAHQPINRSLYPPPAEQLTAGRPSDSNGGQPRRPLINPPNLQQRRETAPPMPVAGAPEQQPAGRQQQKSSGAAQPAR